jgi:hypothetical protein
MKRVLKTLLGCNLASFVHLLRGQPQQFVNGCLSALSAARFPTPTANLPLPSVSLARILGARKADICLTVSQEEEGVLPYDQALALASILVAERPKSVLEVGTFMGTTTRLMAENLPDGTIHTVDLPLDFSLDEPPRNGMPKDDFQLITHRVVGREFLGQPCASRIVQHHADTAEWNFSAAAPANFFFIDGSHTYEYCKNDSEKCFALCGGEGVFLWHDCDRHHPGVIRFLMEWRAFGRDVRRIEGTPLAYWKGSLRSGEDRRPDTGDQRSAISSQKSAIRGRRPETGDQTLEVRNQRAEFREQTANRNQRSEFGSQ